MLHWLYLYLIVFSLIEILSLLILICFNGVYLAESFDQFLAFTKDAFKRYLLYLLNLSLSSFYTKYEPFIILQLVDLL